MPTKDQMPKGEWMDPDDAPHLDHEGFEPAEIWHGDKLIRPGRPKSPSPEETVSLRLDADVLAHYRSTGPGWRSRINADLRKAAKIKARA